MNRFGARVFVWERRLLKFCSKSYREHDAMVSRMHVLRTEAAIANTATSKLDSEASVLRLECSDLRERLKIAIAAQESAAQQLIAERALRQAADERSERYHEQLTDSLKSNVDWLARGLYHRRPMFGVGAPPDEPSTERGDPEQIWNKPMARAVARKAQDSTLRKLYEDIRAGHAGITQEPQVGPEFTTQ